MDEESIINHYYVDEAGDTTLFDKRGRVIVGREGVSRVFMVGVLRLDDPKVAHAALEALRARLLGDPYFKGVPSMQAEARRTALCFHAKDDLPEVRREVFHLLPRLGAKVVVAVRRKDYLLNAARMLHARGSKLQPDDIYDDLVKRLFRNLLHKASRNVIIFARRGKSARERALERAIKRARSNFEKATGITSEAPTTIQSGYPSCHAGLQIVDYHLWALQRLYERREDRFFKLLRPAYRLIMDLDDTRNKPYGEWYSDSNLLELEKVKPVVG